MNDSVLRPLAALFTFLCIALPLHAASIEESIALIKSGSSKQGLSQLEHIANTGNAEAQSLLGDIYADGQWVVQNFSTAAKWRERAAAAGHIPAMNAIGKHYAEGYGVEADLQLAERYLVTAAETGDREFQYDAGVLYDNPTNALYKPEQAIKWYKLAAEQQQVNAQASYGLMLYQGRGTKSDAAEALTWLQLAAEAGHAAAQNNLGLLYVRGEGTTQDHDLAVLWFSKAAEGGHSSALTNLAVMYENGLGVAFDEQEAMRLYKLAGQKSSSNLASAIAKLIVEYDPRLVEMDENAALNELKHKAHNNDPVAQFQLGWYHAQLAAEPDFSKARIAFEASAQQGMHSAMLNLGILHLKGLGVPQDFVVGYNWITRAVAGGSASAEHTRNSLFPFMMPDQIDRAQQLSK